MSAHNHGGLLLLLTITYEGLNTPELGFLLHKNPERPQQFTLSFGKAYIFYPEVSPERTTFALLLDIDPLDLARGKVGSSVGGLFDYVNDRPYAATSFMSTAIARVLGTALSGRCDKRPELAAKALNLTATIYSLKDNGNEKLAHELFEPLGYTIETERTPLDENFPDWGPSPYINLTIKGTVRLSELLNHLYVLIPVFDHKKHYYTAADEIEKLLAHGRGWLENHPAKEKITRRYLAARKSYANIALKALLPPNDNDAAEGEENPRANSIHNPLNTARHLAVKEAVLQSGAQSVIDLGCGEGQLTELLLKESQLKKVTAADVATLALERAARRLNSQKLAENIKEKLTIMQAALTYRDERFKGYDAACLVEVIEHIDRERLPALERVVFEFAAPKTVIITTPNREFNKNYAKLEEGGFRHPDHRFEWTGEEFTAWAEQVGQKFGYSFKICGIGAADENGCRPTQMGVFSQYDL